ncbi:lipopolysaccharide biosynthesis protein [Rudanella paleaurantiibacter]|uniref:Lipopolysaccharide biosynthesis protein n=1 Tax=Rudanella paleaurantiibacter TaxID=2614655 RepID=A0A7J5U3Y0_9BACT|nr:lipopolysaccharide biosynthesis protein [Rudanella paleaurantiibacter]KAB7732212.1 lipopolysaccharide biosynthesis protein [Rudanella paleaurantiibacter]
MGIIKRQTILSSVFAYAGTGVGFITQGLLFPKLLTKDQVGLIAVLLSWSVLLAQFSNLGLNGAGGRFFPYFRDHERQHNGYLLLSMLTTATGVLLCSVVLVAFRDEILNWSSDKSALFTHYYFWLIPLISFLVAFTVFDNYAKLLYDTVPGTIFQQFINRLLMLAAIGAYGLKWLTFRDFMYAWMTSWLIPALLMLGRVVQKHGFGVSPRFFSVSPDLRKQLFQYSALSLLTALSSNIILTIGNIMINADSGLSNAGIYNTASYFGSVIALPAASLYKVAGTIIADAWKRNDPAHIADVYERSCLNQLIIGCLVFVGIAANLPNVFQWLPAGYEAGYYVVLWIGLGKLIDMATGLNGTILATSRYYAYDSAFFIGLIFITIGVNAWLIPRYGINGAAMGAAFVTALFNFVRTVFVWVKFGMQPFSWRNGAVLGVGALVWWLAVQYPYGTGTVRVITDVALRSALITGVFGSLILVLKLSPDLNQTVAGLRKRING